MIVSVPQTNDHKRVENKIIKIMENHGFQNTAVYSGMLETVEFEFDADGDNDLNFCALEAELEDLLDLPVTIYE
jgi:hypothetical protein